MVNLAELRICFVAGTLGQGGAERQLFYLARALRESGASLRLLCLTRGEFWETRLSELGVRITWVGQQESRLVRLTRILNALRQERPDVLQSQHFYTNLYVVAAARMLRLTEVAAMRNDGISEVRANGRVMGRLSLWAPRFVAANSQAAIRNAVRLGISPARLHPLPNVVDASHFTVGARRKRESIRLLAAGRLDGQKRVDRFLSLLARLRRQSPKPVKGIVVGAGPEGPQLVRQAAELGLLPSAVEFRGVVPDMSSVYHESDIVVLTSDYEGTPNVLLEAMASGLPVVATRVGGVGEIVQDEETGYLANAGDEDVMADCLLKLILEEDLRIEMGSRARQYVESHHSVDRLPIVLHRLYTAALS